MIFRQTRYDKKIPSFNSLTRSICSLLIARGQCTLRYFKNVHLASFPLLRAEYRAVSKPLLTALKEPRILLAFSRKYRTVGLVDLHCCNPLGGCCHSDLFDLRRRADEPIIHRHCARVHFVLSDYKNQSSNPIALRSQSAIRLFHSWHQRTILRKSDLLGQRVSRQKKVLN